MTIDLRNHEKRQPMSPAPVAQRSREREESYAPRGRAPHKQHRERMVTLAAAGVVGLLVIVLLIFGISKAWGYFFAGSEAELRSIVSDVSDHMLLPDDETPTLATVSDMHALEGQEFFRNAEVGDKVLMYLRSRRAIIYRPSIDRIIEVGPITGDAQ